MASLLNSHNQISQNRNQIQSQIANDRISSPSNSQNYLSNSGNNFFPSSASNYTAVNFYNQQDRSHLNSTNQLNKDKAYRGGISDNNKYNYESYINNVMPVNKKNGLEGENNNSGSANLKYNPNTINRQNPNIAESPYNPKSILPANQFSNNNENLNQPSTFLNSPYNASGKINNFNRFGNKSFNNYKSPLDEDNSINDPTNPNISINIINHNYSHYYVNPEEEKKRFAVGLEGYRDVKLDKYNTNGISRPENLNDKYNINKYQNRQAPNNLNNNPVSLQNYSNINKDSNDKKNKYSNINLFRSGNPNMNKSFGNTNNNPKNNIKNINNPNNNINAINNNTNINPQYPENKSNFSKNESNNINNNFKSNKEADINNLDRKLLYNSKQPQDKENKIFSSKNNDYKYNINNSINQNNFNKYNSFLSEKYSSKLSTNNNRPSSAVLVSQSNSSHLSRYPVSSQQIQSFINNNSNYNTASGAYSKEKSFGNSNNININKNNLISKDGIQPKSPNNNFSITMIERQNQQLRERSANPNLRSINKGNFPSNNYINQNYYQIGNGSNNVNLINNPQKGKFGNNLTSSVNNFDMDLSKNFGNRTSRPGTSLNEHKNITRDLSLGTPKRLVNVNLTNNINLNNNNSQGNNFLNSNNNNHINNTKTPNNNYGMVNRSFNALTAKDLVYEEYSSNRENLMKKNYSNNNMAISKSVERSKYQPSTPSYYTSNNYFSQNQGNQNMNSNINNNYHQKQNSENNYTNLINNFPVQASNFLNIF